MYARNTVNCNKGWLTQSWGLPGEYSERLQKQVAENQLHRQIRVPPEPFFDSGRRATGITDLSQM